MILRMHSVHIHISLNIIRQNFSYRFMKMSGCLLFGCTNKPGKVSDESVDEIPCFDLFLLAP